MYKVIVCIKQVPSSNKVKVDPITGVLQRNGTDSKMNPYDLYAIETAVNIKKNIETEIVVLTMGPPQASEIIREAYSLGADKGYIISDRSFAGSDVLATSYILSEAIKKIGDFDLILCGKQTTDGDTAQVGPALAERLNIPHVSWVSSLIDFNYNSLELIQDLGEYTQEILIETPCLLSVEPSICELRLPSYKQKINTKDRDIIYISSKDLSNCDLKMCGLDGSPTQVERIFPPEININKKLYELDSLSSAKMILELL